MDNTKITGERKRKLRTLAKLMAKQSKRYLPITGELIKCFDVAISPEETDFLISMGTKKHTYAEIESLCQSSRSENRILFDKLLSKGMIKIFIAANGEEQYQLQGIVVGWFEKYMSTGQMTDEKKEFGRRFSGYMKTFYQLNRLPLRGVVNLQTMINPAYNSIAAIPVVNRNKNVKLNAQVNVPEKQVMPAGYVDALIDKYGTDGKIAVMNCFCRRVRQATDRKCLFKQDEEVCLGLGAHADYIVRCGIGRYISKEKAMEIIRETEKKGAIHTIMHYRDDAGNEEIEICNCCWDCCGILGTYNRGILALSIKSHYIAGIKNSENCIGCGTCSKHCPSAAITILNKKSSINVKRCIGCGQCAFQCQNNVIELKAMERRVNLPMLKRSEARVVLS